jgi:hypothetical protein
MYIKSSLIAAILSLTEDGELFQEDAKKPVQLALLAEEKEHMQKSLQIITPYGVMCLWAS